MPNTLGYLTIGTHYLQIAESACDELIKNKNTWFFIQDKVEGKPFSWEEYDHQTKWSDHSVGIAILFNFFHGIEVTLKGFISMSDEVPRHHRLTELYSAFNSRFPDTSLGDLVRLYTMGIDRDSPLGQFFATNELSVDSWYQSLKYPESTSGESFSHYELKYGGEDTIAFWQSIGQGSRQLRREAVALYGSLELSPGINA